MQYRGSYDQCFIIQMLYVTMYEYYILSTDLCIDFLSKVYECSPIEIFHADYICSDGQSPAVSSVQARLRSLHKCGNCPIGIWRRGTRIERGPGFHGHPNSEAAVGTHPGPHQPRQLHSMKEWDRGYIFVQMLADRNRISS